MERIKTWMTVLLVLCVAMAVTMKENMVGLLLGMWASEPNTFPYDLDNRLQASQVRFAGELMGPESLAFDREGRGPYTGVSDGRILRWDGPRNGWFHFAHTSPHRDAECAPKDQPTPNFEYEHICGRPLGLRFDNSGTLFIADAYYGLLSVGLNGGLAVPLVTHVEGANLTFPNDLDFDAEGFLYFTESSSIHQRREFVVMFIDGDNSGKLIRYDPRTGTTKVLLRGLQFPNGVSISKDDTFLLISETITWRLLRYWLKGPKTSSVEVFAFLPGYPDNVRLNENGDFWVAIHAFPNPFLKIPVNIRILILRIPLPWTQIFSKVSAKRGRGMIIRYGIDGQVLEVLEDRDGLVVKLMSEVEEKDGLLWLGSVLLPHIVVYNRTHHGYSHM